MSLAFDIVPMTDADLPAVLALLEENGLPAIGVQENIAGFIVARSNGAVIASAAIESYGASGLLRSLAVAGAHRRQGIATALVRRTLQKAVHERLEVLYLLTTSAAKYFERFGFVACARDEAPRPIRDSWEFRTGCPASAVLMRRA
jgi:amino-acid N-acetyltransferase